MTQIDLSKYKNNMTRNNQLVRMLWTFVWAVFARPFPRRSANAWKLFLLRLFGAKLHKTAVVYSSANVYMPQNLEMHEFSCLAPEVDCYNVDLVVIGAHSTISQKTYICTASHDITKLNNPLITSPIVIEDQVWVGASAFIGMGITVGKGAVIGATASVYKNVEAWTIVGGNPAKFIKKRILND